MRLMCIDVGSYHLTVGKIYNAERILDEYTHLFDWWIYNDKGYRHMVESQFFKTLYHVRANKLNELLK